ncbi:hypothetical protein OTU49_011832 [Cherax quadricarinatus]|uniref:EGF-like domain-containing protein n=1 Tax=Cherax quadricarinatus TaxID=27406 RepID=A0AAW0W3H8_CHEQU
MCADILDLCEPRPMENGRKRSVEQVWQETQQIMEKSEHLVKIMTHVCCQQLSGVYRTLATYSQGCWRGCSSVEAADADRGGHLLHSACVGSCRSICQAGVQQEGCRCRGPGWGWWRRRRGRCQSGQCEGDCRNMDSGGLPPPSSATTTTHSLCCPPPTPSSTPNTTTTTITTTTTTTTTTSSRSCMTTHWPRWRSGAPPHPSLLTILLLLIVTSARLTESCSSRSTPKPRPPSPTLRPNITFQTYACPPAYAAWYCLNGATCFTVKIGESILYNCECAEGFMGQRCEFKDLDGSYLPAREKVLLETASIAGGATVACVLVFVVLFAVYVFMQKDKDKRCRELDDGCENDRQPFSGYQNPRPEIIRTITNPYARTLEELSHVEVQTNKLVSGGESGREMTMSGDTCDTSTETNIHSAQNPS